MLIRAPARLRLPARAVAAPAAAPVCPERLRALPLRRPRQAVAMAGRFPDCQARAVLWPERFRGRLLLRRRPFGRALPRGLSGSEPPATRTALAGPNRRVNAARGEVLARRVILELIAGHLEADQML